MKKDFDIDELIKNIRGIESAIIEMTTREIERNRAVIVRNFLEMQQRYGPHKFPEELIKSTYASDVELQKAEAKGIRAVQKVIEARQKDVNKASEHCRKLLAAYPKAAAQVMRDHKFCQPVRQLLGLND